MTTTDTSAVGDFIARAIDAAERGAHGRPITLFTKAIRTA